MKRAYVILAILMIVAKVYANSILVDGIYYDFDKRKPYACVARPPGSDVYKGNIIIPESVEYEGETYVVIEIKDNAFTYCQVDTLVVPQSVRYIGSTYIDRGETSIENVFIPSWEWWNSLSRLKSSGWLNFPHIFVNGEECDMKNLVLPEGLTNICENAFSGCEVMETLTIPSSVKNIDTRAFYRCFNLKEVYGCEGLEYIRYEAFYGCSNLTNFPFTPALRVIGKYSFQHCRELQSVEATNLWILDIHAFECCYSLKYAKVSGRSIGESCFRDCRGLKEVEFCNVDTIGEYGFYDCENLERIEYEGLKHIAYGAFAGCSKLEHILIHEPLKSMNGYWGNIWIGDMATWCLLSCGDRDWNNGIFDSQGKEIHDLVVPDGVTSVGNFGGTSSLETVTLPQSVATIRKNAFLKCSSLRAVSGGEGVKAIGISAFERCGLPSFIIPDSVTEIGDYAFRSSSMTRLEIGAEVASIGKGAFNSPNLLTVVSRIAEPYHIGADVFSEDTYRKGELIVPAGMKDVYGRFDGWRNFLHISEEAPEACSLSIKDTDGGTTMLQAALGDRVTLTFKAETDWHIHSVTFNDADVSGGVGSDGLFVTPRLTGNSIVRVVYEQDANDGVPSLEPADGVRLSAVGGGVLVTGGTRGMECKVYGTDGRLVRQVTLGGETATRIPLPVSQSYIVCVGGRRLKVSL